MAGGLIFKYFNYLNLYLYLPHLYLTNSVNYSFWVTKESLKIHMNVYFWEYLYFYEQDLVVACLVYLFHVFLSAFIWNLNDF